MNVYYHELYNSDLHCLFIEMSQSLYLVMMMVFITPTANNIIVMVELHNGDTTGSKEVLSLLIGWQYVLAPLFLCVNVALLVKIVHGWK